MSYTFLLDAEAESLAASFSDIPASVLSRLNLIAEKSCCNGSETESCQSSQSGMTCEHSMANHGKEKSMSCVGDFRVRTLAKLERVETMGSTEREADCGQRWPESLAKWNPLTFSWKTHQCSLFEDSIECLETLPRWGLMRNGELYRQPMQAPPISESEFGYLPTPVAALGKFDAGPAGDFVSCFRKMESGIRPSGAAIGSSLRWHPEFIHEWQRTGGELNAQWIEVLMGWPIDWTDLQPLAMAKFQQWLNSHGKP